MESKALASQGTKRRILVVDDQPDITITLKIALEEGGGFLLYERLKTVDPGIKVCFLTASEMYHEEMRGIEHCALNEDLFLQKPISTDDLIMEINKKINST